MLIVIGATPFTGGNLIVWHVPPFPGASPVTQNWTNSTGCTITPKQCHYSFVVLPSMNVTSGKAVSATNVTARCLFGNGGCRLTVFTLAGLVGSPLTAAATTNVTVHYRWSVTWAAGANGTGFVRIWLAGNLFDNTTQTFALRANGTILVYQAGSMANYRKHGPEFGSATNDTFSLGIVVPVTKGHTYLFYTGIATLVSAFGLVAPGCAYSCRLHFHGDAWSNIGTGTNGAQLLDYRET